MGAWMRGCVGAWMRGCSGMGVKVRGREGVQEKVESSGGKSGGGKKDISERIID